MTFPVVFLIVVIILLIVLFIPVGIGAKYEDGVFVIVKISILKFDIPLNRKVKKLSKKNNSSPDDDLNKSIISIDFILSLLGDFRRFVRKRLCLEEFNLNLTFGTSEASSTAVSTGALWGIVYNLLGLVDKVVRVKNPKVDITPEFNTLTLRVSTQGIVTSCIAHIIAVTVVFVFKYLKYKKSRRTNK